MKKKQFNNTIKKTLSIMLAFILVLSGLVFPQNEALADGGAGNAGAGGGNETGDYSGYIEWFDNFNDGNPTQGWNNDSKAWWRSKLEAKYGKMGTQRHSSPKSYEEIWNEAADEALRDARKRSGTNRARIVGVLSYRFGTTNDELAPFESHSLFKKYGRQATDSELPDSSGWSTLYENNDGATEGTWRNWLYEYGKTKAGGDEATLTMVVWAVAENEPRPAEKPLKLKKESTNPSYVKGNPNYSLAGAEYGIYKSRDEAKTDRNRLGTFTSNANGDTNELNLTKGTYYVKEVKAPKGYKLDNFGGTNKDGVYKVEFTKEGQTFTVKDVPKTDPLSLMLKKTDTNGKGIANAEFEVKYYPELTDDVTGLTPKYTWKFKTDEKGILGLNDKYKIGGDALPKDENGKTAGFIGTYTLQETKAPKGYILDDTLHIRQLKEEGGTSNVMTFNAPTHENKTQKMKFTLQKQDVITGSSQGDASLQGAEYNIVALEDTATHKKGDIVKTVTTDANGKVEVSLDEVGKYAVVEVKESDGYNLNPLAITVVGEADGTGNEYTSLVTQTTTNAKPLVELLNQKIKDLNTLNRINANGGEYEEFDLVTEKEFKAITSENPTVVTNELVHYGRISVTKHEESADENKASTSGERVKEAGIEFKVTSEKTGKEFVIKTDKDGRATTNWLPRGWYKLEQVTKVPGLINIPETRVYIEGDFKEYQFNLENNANVKELQLIKVDKETGERIEKAGIEFELYDENKNQIEHSIRYPNKTKINTFVTDETGTVTLPEKVTPGTYYIKEIKAPKGYFLDPNGEMIKLEILDDDKTIVEFEVENQPQKGELTLEKLGRQLAKVEVDGNGITQLDFEMLGLAGTKWQLIARGDITSYDGKTVLYKDGDIVKEFETTKDPVKVGDIPLGKYWLVEVSTPGNFVLDENKYELEFKPQEQHIKVDSQTESRTNERKDLTFKLTKEFENSVFKLKPKAEFGLFLKEDYTENGITIPKDSMLDKITVEAQTSQGEAKTTTEVEIIETYEVKEVIKEEVEDKDKPIFEYKVGEEVFATLEEAKAKETEELKVETVIKGYETKEVVDETVHTFTNKEEAEAFAKEKDLEVTTIKTEHEVEKTVVPSTFVTVEGKFKNIEIDGKFYIKELSTDENYVLDETQNEVEFDFEKVSEAHSETNQTTVKNKLQSVKVKVVKTEMGSNGKAVAGAKFKLVAVTQDGEVNLGEYLTNENGVIEIELQKGGKYYLSEIEAPKGYLRNEDKIEVDTTDAKDGDLIEKDFENERIPEIKTTAKDSNTGKKNIVPTEKVKITDRAYYKNLIVGKLYEMIGHLRDVLTGNKVLDKAGKPYEVRKEFTPTERNGFVDLEFVVNSSDVRGKETVVFEDLYRDGRKVKTHSDLNDKDQTVRITDPKINTKFVTIDGAKEINHTGKVIFVDHNELTDLVIGETYTSRLTVMDYTTRQPLLDKAGKPYVAEVTFVATSENMVIEVPIEVDLTDYKSGGRLVAFEELIYKGEVVAYEKDFENKEQTITVKPLVLDIRIAKADSKNIKHFLKGAEITVFNQDGTIAKDIYGKDAVGVTDENGEVRFEIYYNKDNQLYVMETKAPNGYIKTDEKFEVKLTDDGVLTTDLIRINILNEAIVIPPQTGIMDVSPMLMLVAAFVLVFIGKKFVFNK